MTRYVPGSFALCLGGCVPFVVPPVHTSVGGTPRAGSDRGGVQVDVGFSPLQLFRSQIDRKWDATVWGSYTFDGENLWGIKGGVGPVFQPWRGQFENVLRICPQAIARWTPQTFAVGTRLTAETAIFFAGELSSPDAVGVAYGETGIGLYVEALYEDPLRNGHKPFVDTWSIAGGLSVRIPVAVGWACCVH